MHILFLNQYFPPDPAPTGLHLRELADSLVSDGHTVDFVYASPEYRANQNNGGRTIRELKALLKMLLSGFARQRPDLVISATSPPCLLVIATLVAKRHRARSIHWVLDLYPEIAVALGEVRPGFVVSVIKRVMKWCYRSCSYVVALDEDMVERLDAYGVKSKTIRPWVFESLLGRRGSRLWSDSPWVWIYSGNLGRAHEWETILQAQALIEERGSDIHLLFQGGGPSWPAARVRAEELKLRQCTWKSYVAESELPDSLLDCQCCVVTQRPEAQGLLWPSKLGLLLTLPRPLLWIGPTNSAIAKDLHRLPHAGVFAPGDSKGVADWLLELRCQANRLKDGVMFDAAAHRAESLEEWKALVNALGVPTAKAINFSPDYSTVTSD